MNQDSIPFARSTFTREFGGPLAFATVLHHEFLCKTHFSVHFCSFPGVGFLPSGVKEC
jgi:hypothetical protein